MEIIELAKIEEKISPVIERLTTAQLEQGNKSYTPILPSLLWSTVALNFEQTEFTCKALDQCLSHVDDIPFASKALLSQVCNALDQDNMLAKTDLEALTKLREAQYRNEQLEVRDNAREYKHLYGVDVASELENAI